MTPADLDCLRAQLVDMRRGLVERLADRLDGGDLALLGSVGAALAAVGDLLQEDEGREGVGDAFSDDATPAGLAPQVAEPLNISVPVPSFSSLWNAALRRDNSMFSLRESLLQPRMAPFDPAYDPFKDIGRYEDYASAFVAANSLDDVLHIKSRIDGERRRADLLDSGGALGWVAAIGAGVLDPINLVPLGQGVAVVRGAGALARMAGGARGAARVGATAGIAQAGQEAVLQGTQVTRPLSESAISIAGATLLGSPIGGAAGLFAR